MIHTDVPTGTCGACLFIGDDFGDNIATIACGLEPGHSGLHEESFARDGGPVVITWTADERRRCDHGCGRWTHEHLDSDSREGCPLYADDHDWDACPFCAAARELR